MDFFGFWFDWTTTLCFFSYSEIENAWFYFKIQIVDFKNINTKNNHYFSTVIIAILFTVCSISLQNMIKQSKLSHPKLDIKQYLSLPRIDVIFYSSPFCLCYSRFKVRRGSKSTPHPSQPVVGISRVLAEWSRRYQMRSYLDWQASSNHRRSLY